MCTEVKVEDRYTVRTQALIGREGVEALARSSVLVCGLGGVGGYALEALARAGVAYELHIYKEGPHGMSLANAAVSSPLLAAQDEDVRHAVGAIARRFSGWLNESVAFLRQVFDPVAFLMEGGKLVLTRPEEK